MAFLQKPGLGDIAMMVLTAIVDISVNTKCNTLLVDDDVGKPLALASLAGTKRD